MWGDVSYRITAARMSSCPLCPVCYPKACVDRNKHRHVKNPFLYCTKMCTGGKDCQYKKRCQFAHPGDALRVLTSSDLKQVAECVALNAQKGRCTSRTIPKQRIGYSRADFWTSDKESSMLNWRAGSELPPPQQALLPSHENCAFSAADLEAIVKMAIG